MEKLLKILKNIFLSKKGLTIFIIYLILEVFTNLTRNILMDYSKINDYIKFSDMLKIGSLKINRGIVFSLIFNWIIYIITNQFVKLITNIFLPKNNSKLDMSQFILENTLEII